MLAKRCGNVKQALRARAIAMVLEGMSRTAAARPRGMDLQILRDWVLRNNSEGFAGLADRLRGGSESWLTEAQIDEVHARVKAGSDLGRDGAKRWSVEDIMRKIEEAFGIIHTESGVGKLLQRIGFPMFRHTRPTRRPTSGDRRRL